MRDRSHDLRGVLLVLNAAPRLQVFLLVLLVSLEGRVLFDDLNEMLLPEVAFLDKFLFGELMGVLCHSRVDVEFEEELADLIE